MSSSGNPAAGLHFSKANEEGRKAGNELDQPAEVGKSFLRLCLTSPASSRTGATASRPELIDRE
jgi:hypothetical protein